MNTNAHRGLLLAPVLLCSSIFLIACGEGTISGNGTKTGSLTLQSSTPQFDQKNVGLQSTISITVNEALDPTSVQGTQTIHLMPAPMDNPDHEMSSDNADSDMTADIVSGTANLNGNTITFTPSTALSPGTRYHFHMSGIKLANGNVLPTGTDELEFFFTTAHSHEKQRVYYNEAGQQICTRNSAVENNVRIMRQYKDVDCTEASRSVKRAVASGATLPLTTHYKRGGHNPTVNGIPVTRYTEWGAVGSDNVMVYEREYKQNGVDYVRFRKDQATGEFLATDWWSESVSHGAHMLTYSYEATNNTGVANFDVSGAKNEANFILDDASLMEMNHNLQVPTAGMFPHRHIFFRNLGANGVIDMLQSASIIDDQIRAYHTREYDTQGRRVKDWTFMGNTNGATVTLDTNIDKATRVRVYRFDSFGQRQARFSYQSDAGKTVVEWNTFLANATLTSNPADATTLSSAGVELHDYRQYSYDGQGNLNTIEVIHECSTACSGYNSTFGVLPNMYREQTRTYTTQSVVSLPL